VELREGAVPPVLDTAAAGALMQTRGHAPHTHACHTLTRRRVGIAAWVVQFLINQDGVPVKRYTPKFATEDCAADIKALIEKGPNALA
jgi:hypothetical protein